MGLLATLAFLFLMWETRLLRHQAFDAIRGGGTVLAMLLLLLVSTLIGWLIGGPDRETRRILATSTGMRSVIASLSVFGSADSGRALLFHFFERFLPAPAFQFISQAFNGIIHASGPLKMSLEVIASLWSASLGVGAMMDTLNAVYNVKETRSLIKPYTIAVGLTCGVGLLVVSSVVVLVFGEEITAARTSNALAVTAWTITRWLLTLAATFLVLAGIYFFGPNLRKPKWRWITPGSIAAVFLSMLASIGSKAYIRYFGTYNLTYCSLGAVIILLLFFYLSGVAVLAGAVCLIRFSKGPPKKPL